MKKPKLPERPIPAEELKLMSQKELSDLRIQGAMLKKRLGLKQKGPVPETKLQEALRSRDPQLRKLAQREREMRGKYASSV